MPESILENIRYIPTREYQRFRHTERIMNAVSKRLIEEKSQALLAGDQSSRDIMSILGKNF